MWKVKKLDHDHQQTPPKLCLLITRPLTAPEAPTPPPKTAVSVPFEWEEAPGKPRPCHTTRSDPAAGRGGVVRALDLPPRLSFVENNNNRVVSSSSSSISPTTVLDGPYVGRAVSFTTSYRSDTTTESYYSNFGSGSSSSRWGGLKKKSNREDNFDFSSWSADGTSTSKVKITRVIRRRGSFLRLSHGTSHFLENIYESFKQVVPWRRRQEKEKQATQK